MLKICAIAAAGAALCGAALAGDGPEPAERPRTIVIRTTPPEDLMVQRLRRGDHRGALEAIDLALRSRPDDPVLLYNRACAKAQVGAHDAAARNLMDAVRHGFDAFSHMQRDPDLLPLRDHDVFRAIVAARAHADEILASRRLDEWKKQVDAGRYRVHRDENQRLIYLSSLNDGDLEDVRCDASAHLDRLSEMLFGEPPPLWTLIVLPDRSDRQAGGLADRRHAYGVYRHHRRELIALDTGVPLRHELVHLAHHRHMDELGQQHPIWIQEGLAVLFEEYERSDSGAVAFTPGERQNLAKHLLRDERLFSWRTLLAMDDGTFNRESHRTYAQVDSMMRFIAQRADLGEWYALYVSIHAEDPTGAQAIQRLFDAPLAQIEQRWREWLDAQPFIVAASGPGCPAAAGRRSATRPPARCGGAAAAGPGSAGGRHCDRSTAR